MYRILHLQDGTFTAECQIQDGTERFNFTNRLEAVQWLIKSARVLNHDYIREDDIECLDEVITPSPLPSQDEQRLLDLIRRKESVVVSSLDKRIRYRISDAECQMIVEIREGVRVTHYKD